MGGRMNKSSSRKILYISFLFLLIAFTNKIPAQNNLFTQIDTLTFKLTEKQKELLTTIIERHSTKKVGLYLVSDLKQLINDSCFSINIFTFSNLEITKKKIELTNFDNFVYYGSIRNLDGDILLVVIDKELTGTLRIDKNIYKIEPLGFGAHVMIEIDQSGFPPEHAPDYNNDILQYDKELKIERDMSGQSGSVIDILVAYTPSAANAHGNINGLIITAINESNQSYQNSNVLMRINLVHTVQVNYTESGDMFLDLMRFQGTSDGYMDEIHGLRDYYGGDVCVLIVNDETNCGLAPLFPQASSAFCVVHYDCAAGNYSFAHEIGHIQGCRHDMFVDPNLFPFAYGHGYVYLPGEWRTVMAYNDECDCSDEVTPCPPLSARNTPDYPWCDRLQFWSNPDVYYGGVAMGTTEYEDDSRVLDETANTIAGYRTPLLELWANEGKSANQTATAYNNGRRLVRDGANYLHLVFASGGQIFYRKRTPSGEWVETTKISTGLQMIFLV